MNAARVRFGFIALAIASGPATLTFAETKTPSATVLRLDTLLWREVRNHEGKNLGAVSDVLVQMPSGRIVFVLVKPSTMYKRPKAIQPESLFIPSSSKAALRLDLSFDDWVNAPKLDWNPNLVVKNTSTGTKVYATYEVPWATRKPTPNPLSEIRVSGPNAQPAPEKFISLNRLLLERVATAAWHQDGFVRDFLIDWSAKRATHALISPWFTAAAGPKDVWFAIPLSLLNPPLKLHAITVNSDAEGFHRAPLMRSVEKVPPNNRTEIFRYPAVEETMSGRIAQQNAR